MNARFFLFLVGIVLLTPVLAAAKAPTVLFLFNNGKGNAHVWVNSRYQGVVPPKGAAYTLVEGFVTRDSGIQPDGSIKATYAYAGWDSTETVSIKIRSVLDGIFYDGQINASGSSKGESYIWFGEDKAGVEPNDVLWENAMKILPAKPPRIEQRLGAWSYRAIAVYSDGRSEEKKSGTITFQNDRIVLWTPSDSSEPSKFRYANSDNKAQFSGEYPGYTDSWELTFDQDDSARLSRIVKSARGTGLTATWTGEASRKGGSEDIHVKKVLGTGDVQITLRWSGAPDLDLHVVTPSGEEISYTNKTSTDGGCLDVDDTNGNGPENVFWADGAAPKGEYQVRVVLYNGDTARYSVEIIVDGKSRTFQGTIVGGGSKVSVASFSR